MLSAIIRSQCSFKIFGIHTDRTNQQKFSNCGTKGADVLDIIIRYLSLRCEFQWTDQSLSSLLRTADGIDRWRITDIFFGLLKLGLFSAVWLQTELWQQATYAISSATAPTNFIEKKIQLWKRLIKLDMSQKCDRAADNCHTILRSINIILWPPQHNWLGFLSKCVVTGLDNYDKTSTHKHLSFWRASDRRMTTGKKLANCGLLRSANQVTEMTYRLSIIKT